MEIFKNPKHEIPEGTHVGFEMENQSMWGGDNDGFLKRKNDKWVIETKRSGTIGIGGWLEAYPNTIYPIN